MTHQTTESTPIDSGRPWLHGCLLVLSVVFWAAGVSEYLNATVDDVFITLRVANNVANGDGYVYNIGENVEGHSNWSWVTLLAAASRLTGVDSSSLEMVWLAKILAVLCSALTLVVLFFLARRYLESTTWALLTVLATVATTTFSFWSVCGLESPLFMLLVLTSVLSAASLVQAPSARLEVLLGLVLVFIGVTRPEGIAYAIILLATVWLVAPMARRSLLYAGFILLVGHLIFLSWRYSVYGLLVPNTYYAKTGKDIRSYLLGLKYFLEGLFANLSPWLLLLPLAFRKRSDQPREVELKYTVRLLILSQVLFGIFFVLYSTGDWMPAYRFLLPVLPLILLLCMEAAQRVWALLPRSLTYPRRTAILVTSIMLLGGMIAEGRLRTKSQIAAVPSALDTLAGHSLYSHALVGDWIRSNPDIQSFAAGEAGLIGFLNPDRKLLDLSGLMDTTIARRQHRGQPLDVEYVLDRRPDAVIIWTEVERPTSVLGSPAGYTFRLRTSPRFQREYAPTDTLGIFTIYRPARSL